MSPQGRSRLKRALFRYSALGAIAVGLTLLLMALAGVFRPKVPAVPTTTVARGLEGRPTGEVLLVRRPRLETAVGTVRAVHEASVASKLLARIVEVRVKAGQAVKEGEILVRLDDADLKTRLKQAESAAAAAQAVLERATLDHERTATLVEKKAVSRSQLDQAVAALRTSKADVQRTEQSVEEARVTLEFATIRSPMTGTVIDKRVEPGDTANPGQVLVTLYEPTRMQMVATVRESLAQRLKVGDEIPARLDAIQHECLATVSEIVPQAEVGSRSFTVKVTGPCPPGAYSGMFGRISIPLEDEDVLVVPGNAVFRVGQLTMVEVVEDGRTQRRSVQLGRRIVEGYEVLAGLRPGEQVLLRTDAEGRS